MSLPILIVNPNTTAAMTEGLKPLLESFIASSSLPPPVFFTSPTGVPSINNDADCHHSASEVLPLLTSPSGTCPSVFSSSAVLVACYSVHPLVGQLKRALADVGHPPRPVLGIFEASILASLNHLAGADPDDQFGIVTTGAVWEQILSDGVRGFLGATDVRRFAGVATTGLSAVELHDAPADEVKTRLKDATKCLIRQASASGKGRLRAVCLGCAGMAGMDEMVREACVEELGAEGEVVRIVDGVKAGYAMLEGMVRMQY
ncbi:hypothetical protein JCM10207_008396 [Rhodosporidiobolus poonsookiae]